MKTDSRFKKYALSAVLALALLATAAAWCAGGYDSDSTPTEPANVVKNGSDNGNDSLRDVLAGAASGATITFAEDVTNITLSSAISFGQSDITIDGGGRVTITKSTAANFRLLTSNAASGTLTLKGLTFENGRTTENGGGVLAKSDVKLEGCVFKNNIGYDGGGLYASANADLTGCKFFGNTAVYNGGGLYADGTADIKNCEFDRNAAVHGGGAYVNGKADLAGCTLNANSAPNGGGVYANHDADMTGCRFTNNTADDGGAAYVRSNADLTDCMFIDNKAERNGNGGGLYAGTAVLKGCVLDGNTAAGSNGNGGGVYSAGDAVMNDCMITGNTAGNKGAGVYACGDATLTHCAFNDNVAADPAEKGAYAVGKLETPDCTFERNKVKPADNTLLLVGIAAASIIIGLIAIFFVLQSMGKLPKTSKKV